MSSDYLHHRHVIPEELAETHIRLTNWGRWAWDRPSVHRAWSAEGRYRPEGLRDDEADDRRRPVYPVDQRDALIVMRAINPVRGFPARSAFALAAEYIYRLEPFAFATYMRRHRVPIRHRDLLAEINNARWAAHSALRRVEAK